jgi:hypothetical protein
VRFFFSSFFLFVLLIIIIIAIIVIRLKVLLAFSRLTEMKFIATFLLLYLHYQALKRERFFFCVRFHSIFKASIFLSFVFASVFDNLKERKNERRASGKMTMTKKKVLMKLLNEKQKLSYFIELHNIITSQMKSLSFCL